MTEEKEFCKFYQKGRKCSLKQDDFRCIENIGGNCASYRYYAFELEQENKDLKKQIESDKGLITVGGKQQYQYLQKIDELEQENKQMKSALEEIRKECKCYGRQRGSNREFDREYGGELHINIIEQINEVLNEGK